MESPCDGHWDDVLSILLYIKLAPGEDYSGRVVSCDHEQIARSFDHKS